MNPFYKNLALWLVISLMMVVLFNLFTDKAPMMRDSISYSELLNHIDRGEISKVVIQGNEINGEFLDGRAFKSYAPRDPDMVKSLKEKGVQISAKRRLMTTLGI